MCKSARILLLFLFLCCTATAQKNRLESILQPAAMQEDFTYLRRMLETTHPGLYKHQSRESMQHKMDSLARQLDRPLPFTEFYKKIAYLIAEVRCEHTYCNYGDGFGELLKTAKLLPFQLFFLGDKVYIAVNRTADASIHLGDELLSINGYPIDSIRRVLYQYIPSDGYMLSSKDHQLSAMAFNIWYYLFVERPDHFELTFKNKEGQLIRRRYDKNLGFDKSNKLALKNPANEYIFSLDKQKRAKAKNPWHIEWLDTKNAALLTVRTFGGEESKFVPVMDSIFNELATKKISNLVIDISSNDGGEEGLGAQLLSYFTSQPTRLVEDEYLLFDSDSLFKLSNVPAEIWKHKYDYIHPLRDGRSQVKISPISQELQLVAPKPNGFKGKVYLYTSGVTSSAASTFAALMKSEKLATLVGEETAGAYSGGGTTNGLDLVLPHSKITAHTSIAYMAFATKGGERSRGVLPDYPYKATFAELVKNERSWLTYILSLMN